MELYLSRNVIGKFEERTFDRASEAKQVAQLQREAVAQDAAVDSLVAKLEAAQCKRLRVEQVSSGGAGCFHAPTRDCRRPTRWRRSCAQRMPTLNGPAQWPRQCRSIKSRVRTRGVFACGLLGLIFAPGVSYRDLLASLWADATQMHHTLRASVEPHMGAVFGASDDDE